MKQGGDALATGPSSCEALPESAQTREPAQEYTMFLSPCVPKRASCSTLLPGKPAYGLMRNLRRDRMSSVELTVPHIVAGVLEPRNDPAATAVDRQDFVTRAVGDENPR